MMLGFQKYPSRILIRHSFFISILSENKGEEAVRKSKIVTLNPRYSKLQPIDVVEMYTM